MASKRTYEFESIGDATLWETWRVSIDEDEAKQLDAEELADRIEDELSAGNAEFVEERAEEERNRDVRRESIEQVEEATGGEEGDWLDGLDQVQVNALAGRVIGEDKIDAGALVALLREAGIGEDEDEREATIG